MTKSNEISATVSSSQSQDTQLYFRFIDISQIKLKENHSDIFRNSSLFTQVSLKEWRKRDFSKDAEDLIKTHLHNLSPENLISLQKTYFLGDTPPTNLEVQFIITENLSKQAKTQATIIDSDVLFLKLLSRPEVSLPTIGRIPYDVLYGKMILGLLTNHPNPEFLRKNKIALINLLGHRTVLESEADVFFTSEEMNDLLNISDCKPPINERTSLAIGCVLMLAVNGNMYLNSLIDIAKMDLQELKELSENLTTANRVLGAIALPESPQEIRTLLGELRYCPAENNNDDKRLQSFRSLFILSEPFIAKDDRIMDLKNFTDSMKQIKNLEHVKESFVRATELMLELCEYKITLDKFCEITRNLDNHTVSQENRIVIKA